MYGNDALCRPSKTDKLPGRCFFEFNVSRMKALRQDHNRPPVDNAVWQNSTRTAEPTATYIVCYNRNFIMSGHAEYSHRQKASELSTSSDQIKTHNLFHAIKHTEIVRRNRPRPRHLFRSTDVQSAQCFALPFTLLTHICTLRDMVELVPS